MTAYLFLPPAVKPRQLRHHFEKPQPSCLIRHSHSHQHRLSPTAATQSGQLTGSPASNGSGNGSVHDVAVPSTAAVVLEAPVTAAQAALGSQPAASSEELSLREEVAELRQLLLQQSGIIQQQQQALLMLEGRVVGHQPLEQQQRPREQLDDAQEAELQEEEQEAAWAAASAPYLGELQSADWPVNTNRCNELVPQQLSPNPSPQRLAAADLSLGIKEPSVGDRRLLGCYDARYHSTHMGATPRDFRLLPRRIVVVRHAQSEGNVDNFQYTYVPDPKVPLTAKGWEQALDAGEKLREIMDADGKPYKLFFYTSPYLRSKQTYEGLIQAFKPEQLVGVQEEVQLREQDFGNFQDAEGKKREKAERLRFGRFFYRFPNGESGADVYDRMTIFEDHLVRDINAGRYGYDSTLVLVTHGLAARIFLMRWFHWTVDQFMNVFNPPNAEPIVMERITSDYESRQGGPASWIHTKALYRLTDASMDKLVGCTEDMCSTSWLPRGIDSPREYSSH
ncbi:hypothetical protein N2152v2_001360 [Parachlorella kessleri]